MYIGTRSEVAALTGRRLPVSSSGGGSSGPSYDDFPVSFALTHDVSGFGSSTMAGTSAQVPTLQHIANNMVTGATYDNDGTIPATGGVYVNNRGAGGTTSATIKATFLAAAARQKAAFQIWSMMGNYAAGVSPEDVVLADVAAMITDMGHSNFLLCPKHFDSAAPTGSLDNTRITTFNRKAQALYPGQVDQAGIMFRNYPPADGADSAAQITDVVPPSLDFDAGHLNTAGYVVLAERDYAPMLWALEGGPAYVPHQMIFCNNGDAIDTNNEEVGIAYHHPSPADGLTGTTVDFAEAQAHFAAVIEAGNIKIKRASATRLVNGYYDLPLRRTKNLERVTSHQRVYLRDPSAPSVRVLKGASDWITREGKSPGVVNGGKKVMVVIGIRVLGGDGTQRRLIHLSNGAGLSVEIKTTNRIGFICRNDINTANPVNHDGPTNLLADADVHWIFCAADTTTGVQVSKNALDASAATTLTPTADAALMIMSPASTTLHTLLAGQNGLQTNSFEIVTIWAATDYLDIGPTTGNRDLFRDPVTRESLIPASGIVGGVTPFLFMQGPAGNFASGMNLMDPNDIWIATNRAQWQSQ